MEDKQKEDKKKHNNKTKKRQPNIVDQLTEIKPIVVRKKKPILNIIEGAFESVQKVKPFHESKSAAQTAHSPVSSLSKCPTGTRRNKDNEIC